MRLIILVTYLVQCSQSANILAILPAPSYSHQVAFFDFWNELSLRGHNVTVITANPQKNEKLVNLTEIDVSWSYEFLTNISQTAERELSMWNMHAFFNNLFNKFSEAMFSHTEIQSLIHSSNRTFDLVIVELLFPEFLGFAELYNCSSILVSSLDAPIQVHHQMGNTDHPVLFPQVGTSFYPPLNFWERIVSTIYSTYAEIFSDYVGYPDKGRLMRKFFNSTSTIFHLVSKVDMLFLNVNPIIQNVRALGPNTVNIGGLRPKTTKPLPEDLAEYLNSSTNGFIYFSLGSNIKSKDLLQESLNAIIETLGDLPFKVLWKFEAEADTIPDKPENVKLIKWAPQLDILAHPNIKVFVTQGGLQSMEESIHNEVPCVVIPFCGDQNQNARLMKSKGFAEIVNRHPHIKKDELKNAILKVAKTPKYKNAVRRLKQLSIDTPMTGLEAAVWWTEYVIRNKGAKQLRNPAVDLPLYQYYLFDVIGFLIVIVVVLTLMTFILVRKSAKFIISKYSIESYGKDDKKIQ